MNDAVKIAYYIADPDLQEASDIFTEEADYNGDGKINILDCVLLCTKLVY